MLKWMMQQFMQFQVYMYRRSAGKTMGTMRGMPLLLLTTIGRKTGKQRVTPMMYLKNGNNYVVTASNNGADKNPAWFGNLLANPSAIIEVGDKTEDVLARKASPDEKKQLWAELVKQAPFFDDYQKKTTREIPMVILQPTDGPNPIRAFKA